MPRLLELFAGTGSVGAAFKEFGWDVDSLDINPDGGAELTWCCDILDFNYRTLDQHYDCIHASPPCTMYSRARTTARTPRDLDGADLLVLRALEIIKYFLMINPRLIYFIENPQTGLLKDREFMTDLDYRDVHYCAYGSPYKKATRIWSNATYDPAWITFRCLGPGMCPSMVGTRHVSRAQRGSGWRQHELYRLPRPLCMSMAAYCTYRRYVDSEENNEGANSEVEDQGEEV